MDQLIVFFSYGFSVSVVRPHNKAQTGRTDSMKPVGLSESFQFALFPCVELYRVPGPLSKLILHPLSGSNNHFTVLTILCTICACSLLYCTRVRWISVRLFRRSSLLKHQRTFYAWTITTITHLLTSSLRGKSIVVKPKTQKWLQSMITWTLWKVFLRRLG